MIRLPDRQSLRLLSAAAIIGWSVLLGGIAFFDLTQTEEHMERLAANEARSNLNKDLAFRLWATSHGGVYVPATERTPPNPAISHLPHRDISGYQGTPLTLMNPAYMLRQLMDEYGEQYGVKGRIVSFKPLNPNNAPDAWEAAALKRFEAGATEVAEFTDLAGQPYLRMMQPMITVAGCLKCHGFQGYQLGDVRGGVGVAVAMRPYQEMLADDQRRLSFTYGLIWLLGLGGILLLAHQVSRRLGEHEAFERELSLSNRQIAHVNAELRKFAEISAHHLQEPARRLMLYAEQLHQRLEGKSADEEAILALNYIRQGAARLRDLVRDIQHYLAVGEESRPQKPLAGGPIIRQVLAELAPQLTAAKGEVTVTETPPIPLSPARLTDLLTVLLDNAIRYRRPETPLRITISGEQTAERTLIRVADNGQGIPAPYREKVLGLFERLHTDHNGTGIGLPIAARIMNAANGSIRLTETPGGGVTVILEFQPAASP